MRTVVSMLLVVLVAGGCSDSVGPGSIAGKWAEDFSFPGSSFEMDLVSTGSTLSGNGSWCAEAGPCGIVTVDGTIKGIDVHLNFASTAQYPQVGPVVNSHFDGRLTSLKNLKGTIGLDPPNLAGNGVALEVNYHRAN